MADSFSKKEKAKKKAKKLKEKAERREQRKTDNNKGQSLEDMLVYVDKNGHLHDTPPVEDHDDEIKLEDIQLGAAPIPEESPIKKGFVEKFILEKGFGFIREDGSTGENLFFHTSDLLDLVKQQDRVTFEKERSPKGYKAINVKKL